MFKRAYVFMLGIKVCWWQVEQTNQLGAKATSSKASKKSLQLNSNNSILTKMPLSHNYFVVNYLLFLLYIYDSNESIGFVHGNLH
jgi:hypothetical protein